MKLFTDVIDAVDMANPTSTSEESLHIVMKRKECESTTVEADVDIQSEPGELHLLYPAVIFWSPLLDCSQLPA